MSSSQSIRRIKSHNPDISCIDDMQSLLDHIDDFSKFIQTHGNLEDKQLQEEMRLFNTYIKWKTEDLSEQSYSYLFNTLKHNA